MESASNSLLPSGFTDLLSPHAQQQRLLHHHVVTTLESFGYEEVSPPLLEFEASLLQGKGEALSNQTFRLMDPQSREMMGLRADMTLQVARIANARLQDSPKPLRLCYAGTCVRVMGEGLRRDRQLMQAGAELIGPDNSASDVEIFRAAVSALKHLSLGDITIDVNLPELTRLLILELPQKDQEAFKQNISRKDRAALKLMQLPFEKTLLSLLDNAGSNPDFDAWHQAANDLPETIVPLLQSWIVRAKALQASNVGATVSFDPLEHEGFEYHSGLAFSIFAQKREEEIGRGGRYLLTDDTPAVGFSLYLTPLLGHMPARDDTMRCYVALDGENTEADCQRLREKGWITLYALEAAEDAQKTAYQNRCSHLLQKGKLIPLERDKDQ